MAIKKSVDNNMERLFVYGTLAPGQVNHDVLVNIPGKWEIATLRGNLVDEGWGSVMGCPGIVPTEDGEEVKGYIFASEYLSDYWSMLDEFEGSGYSRAIVKVKIESGEYVDAFVYALNQAA